MKVIIMNIGSPSGFNGVNQAARKKETIHDTLIRYAPDFVLFQEFYWKSITHSCWKKFPIPGWYCLNQHEDAPILYNVNKFSVSELAQIKIQQYIIDTEVIMNNAGVLSNEFAPNPRMRIIFMKRRDSFKEFIVISWHGVSKCKNKIDMFLYLMTFLRKIWDEYKLPMIIGGDFNIPIGDAKQYVKEPYRIVEYVPSTRREHHIIDFYIVTGTVHAFNVEYIDLNEVSNAADPNQVFDHDPIMANIEFQMPQTCSPEISLPFMWPAPMGLPLPKIV